VHVTLSNTSSAAVHSKTTPLPRTQNRC
jgi:hypothetical protein